MCSEWNLKLQCGLRWSSGLVMGLLSGLVLCSDK